MYVDGIVMYLLWALEAGHDGCNASQVIYTTIRYFYKVYTSADLSCELFMAMDLLKTQRYLFNFHVPL